VLWWSIVRGAGRINGRALRREEVEFRITATVPGACGQPGAAVVFIAREEAFMRKSMADRDAAAHKGDGHKFEKHQKVEGWVDLATLGFIIILGLVMVVGLVTASGNVTW
jgi:hypothetical protein